MTGTVVLAIHDGFYGCGTGAGYANRAFLDVLVDTLPADIRLVVLPVRLSKANPERQEDWHRDVRARLRRAEVFPVDNGTDGLDRWGELANFRRLAEDAGRILHNEVPDPLLVLAFDVPFLGLATVLPPPLVRRLVLVPRSSGALHTPWDRERIAWERAAMARAAEHGGRIAAISGYMRRHLRTEYGVPAAAMIDLRDGLVDEDRPMPTTATLPPFVLAMGRAEPYKGFDDLLDAVEILRTQGFPHLVLAATTERDTPTPYQRQLRERVARLGIDATVIDRFGPEVRGLLTHPRLRAVVVPSRVEPFGRIPVESFLAGAGPVVSTTAGGLAEQVLDGVTGYTAPPGDPARLAAAIRRALRADEPTRRRLRDAGRDLVRRRFDHREAIHAFLAAQAPAMIGYGAPTSSFGEGVESVWVKAPVGIQTPHWNTVSVRRQVLVVAHNVTAATRLLDAVAVFDSDPRVQVVFSWNGSDPFHHGLSELLDRLGMIVIPWPQALQTRFDLAVTANHGGLTEIEAPIVVLSHGMGYTKQSPGNRKSEIGNRKSEYRGPESEGRQVFGLSPQWLLYDGRPIATALVLSHDEQLARLTAAVPAAAHTGVVAGDPCYDRILASLSHRAEYRRALGATDDHTVIALNSTWWRHSLLGDWPELPRRLLAELPVDSYRVVAIVHPNIWHGHGPWQVRTWLSDCLRAGLILVPDTEGWRAALIAADCVIGDHGSTTAYGAALDRPTLLGSFPAGDVAPASPVDVLGGLAPRLHRDRPLRSQIDRAVAEHRPGAFAAVSDMVTSAPHEALERLRRLCYSIMDLAEPVVEPPVHPLPTDGLSPAPVPTALAVDCVLADGTVTITRYPAELRANSGHLVVHIDHPGRRMLGAADVIVGDVDHDPEGWLRAVIVEHPAIALAAAGGPDGVCRIRTRDGDRIDLVPDAAVDTALAASVAYSLLGKGIDEVRVAAGAISRRVALRRLDAA
ncbi:glycosyltransferase [Kutzneria sp. NPDC052558]|uniref:glycosyltransferase n=1 Tax=Kutzneria sp. NPDC052558 TaxID=3364121 RepID=UPI0037C5D80E